MNSRLQPAHRITDGLAKVLWLLSICSSFKGIADIGAEYPKFHAILIVGHLVLGRYGLGTSHRGRKWSSPGW